MKRFSILFLAVFLYNILAGVPSSAAMDNDLVNIRANQQIYDVINNKYDLKGDVEVYYQKYQIFSDTADVAVDSNGEAEIATFYDRPTAKKVDPIAGEDEVIGDTITIFLKKNLFGAKGNVRSYITTIANDPFTIRSDVQQFDNVNKLVTASGSVKVRYKETDVYSANATLRMGADGKAERAIFTGDAKMRQKTSEMQGGKITIMVGSGDLIAENHVKTRVDMGEEANPDEREILIYSDYQQYDKSSDKMLATGHVRIHYGGNITNGPKATFYMKGGGVEKILLTGRSTIIEEARKITADVITITTNPKNFDAVGNVKIQFKTAQQNNTPPATTPVKPATTGSKGTPQKGISLPVAPSDTPLPKDDPLLY